MGVEKRDGEVSSELNGNLNMKRDMEVSSELNGN